MTRTDFLKARRADWQRERAAIVTAMRKGTDNTGWPLSPEAMDNLKLDLQECNLVLQDLAERLHARYESGTS